MIHQEIPGNPRTEIPLAFREIWCFLGEVNVRITAPHRWRLAQAVAGLMLGLWLSVWALAASPQLHRLLHQDAQAPAHQCLITQIQQQPLLVGFVVALVPVPALVRFSEVFRPGFHFLPVSDFRLAPTRGPPAIG